MHMRWQCILSHVCNSTEDEKAESGCRPELQCLIYIEITNAWLIPSHDMLEDSAVSHILNFTEEKLDMR